MKSESTFSKIQRKTGMKPIQCKCKLCASQCQAPCLGTPEDIAKLVGAGYASRLMITERVPPGGMSPVVLASPLYDQARGCCTFFNNGLCELHDKGLKPTEGKLSHHSTTAESFTVKHSIARHVIKEWEELSEEQLELLFIKNGVSA